VWQASSLDGMGPVAHQLLGGTQQLQQLVNDPAAFTFDAAQFVVASGGTLGSP